MDSMLLTLFNGTCGLGISPGRWYCITEHTTLGNSPFSSDDYYIFTFGYLISALMVVPLGFFSLVENIFVQMTSFIVLCAILIQWIVAFCQEGLDTSRLPASGPNSALVLGIVIFNYSYITTVSNGRNLRFILFGNLHQIASLHRFLRGWTISSPKSIFTGASVSLWLSLRSCTLCSVNGIYSFVKHNKQRGG